MDLVTWIYDHPELALGLAGAILAVVRWAWSVSNSLASMASSLKVVVDNIEKHEKRLDKHEVRLVQLEERGVVDHGKAA